MVRIEYYYLFVCVFVDDCDERGHGRVWIGTAEMTYVLPTTCSDLLFCSPFCDCVVIVIIIILCKFM